MIAARSRDPSAIDEIYQEVALAVVKQNAEISEEKLSKLIDQLDDKIEKSVQNQGQPDSKDPSGEPTKK